MRASRALAAICGALVLAAGALAPSADARPTPELHQLLRVQLRTPGDLRDLQLLDLDLTEHAGLTFVDVVATAADKLTLARHGFLFAVIDPDLHASFLAATHNGAPDLGAYHTYDEAIADMQAVHAAFPSLTSDLVSWGKSVQGRDIWAMLVSTTPAMLDDPNKPEVSLIGNHHARELITVEIPLDLLHTLTEQYGISSEVTNIVNTMEVWIVPTVNPDGLVYVATTDENWRKNRRDNGDGSFGVDLNRNYSYKWGIDNVGSSGNTRSDTYRGTAPFSEPETRAVKTFCAAHHLLRNINYHSYGDELIYPWGYDYNIYTPDNLTFSVATDSMVALNGYTKLIGWGLYLTNGEADDWWYGETGEKPRGFSHTPEVGSSFHPADSQIPALLAENRNTALYWIRSAAPVDPAAASLQLSTHTITVGRGGTLSFSYTVTNNTAATVTWKQWDEVVRPNQQALLNNPVGGFKTWTLSPGASRTTTITKVIPTGAPTGTYTWTSKVAATAPWPVWAQDQMSFTITAAARVNGLAASSVGVGDELTWLSDDSGVSITTTPATRRALAATLQHGGGVRFRLSTTADPGARYAVRDVQGREVAAARVVDGGTGLEWDGRGASGAKLPSGLYLLTTPDGAARISVVR